MKKADLCECFGWRSIADCKECPEYDTCDECGRRTCKYVAVTVYHNGESDELICRPCARKQGWNKREIASQAIDPETYKYGEEIHKEQGRAR